MDRYLALLLGEHSIREVIAFPKSKHGEDLMSAAPAPISAATLARYHLALAPSTTPQVPTRLRPPSRRAPFRSLLERSGSLVSY